MDKYQLDMRDGDALTNGGVALINDTGADVLAKVVTLYGDMINSGMVVINNGPTISTRSWRDAY